MHSEESTVSLLECSVLNTSCISLPTTVGATRFGAIGESWNGDGNPGGDMCSGGGRGVLGGSETRYA